VVPYYEDIGLMNVTRAGNKYLVDMNIGKGFRIKFKANDFLIT
jgi:hypothetical protein